MPAQARHISVAAAGFGPGGAPVLIASHTRAEHRVASAERYREEVHQIISSQVPWKRWGAAGGTGAGRGERDGAVAAAWNWRGGSMIPVLDGTAMLAAHRGPTLRRVALPPPIGPRGVGKRVGTERRLRAQWAGGGGLGHSERASMKAGDG